jgi:hypothetical protein
MRTNRTSLFAYVAIAALGVAATSFTASEAAAGVFCGRSFGGGGFAAPRNYSPAPVHREKAVVRRPPPAASKPVAVAKAAPRKPASTEPAKVASTASAAAAAKVASTATTAAAAAEVAQAAGTATANPVRAATPCLTKQYLQTGAVMFKDACTNEWAINSTTATGQKASSVGGNCLTKENHPDGVVMFKDTCTKEWAMNTAERLAEAPPTR